MSISSLISKRYLKKKASVDTARKVVLKKPTHFSKILLITNQPNDQLLNDAKASFKNAEINTLYLREKKEDKTGLFSFAVHPTDFNLTGHLKNDKLNGLIHSDFDMVVDLSSDSVYLNFMISNLKSTLTIGIIQDEPNPYHDLLFENDDPLNFIQTIVKHLNALTAHEK